MVMHSGMPSGIPATAKVTATRIMYIQLGLSGNSGSFVPMPTPAMKTAEAMTIAAMPIRAPSLSTFSWSGVLLLVEPQLHLPASSSSFAIIWAISPIRVSIPVATTTPVHRPLATGHPEKAMFSGVSFVCSLILMFLGTSSGSPVRAFSSTFRSLVDRSLKSAGTTSPVSKTTTSPRTTSTVGRRTGLPSRSTETSACESFAKASSALPAWCSV
mmetsp:Transcript_2472/g.5689  ORF Transcript_2472/g.5689 Transcript_2472/m.5689 type:complete len:214 (-) Transcript_2472:504-1145(-)